MIIYIQFRKTIVTSLPFDFSAVFFCWKGGVSTRKSFESSKGKGNRCCENIGKLNSILIFTVRAKFLYARHVWYCVNSELIALQLLHPHSTLISLSLFSLSQSSNSLWFGELENELSDSFPSLPTDAVLYGLKKLDKTHENEMLGVFQFGLSEKKWI